jgi:hypothetical protein
MRAGKNQAGVVGDAMNENNRDLLSLTQNKDLLSVLKTELEFLKIGGYSQTARAPWRPQFIFQDSPTCLNFDPTEPPRPCAECALIELVPEDSRNKKVACRYIPLNSHGYTIDFFYRYGTQENLEAALTQWLTTTIARLEREKVSCLRSDQVPGPAWRAQASAG